MENKQDKKLADDTDPPVLAGYTGSTVSDGSLYSSITSRIASGEPKNKNLTRHYLFLIYKKPFCR